MRFFVGIICFLCVTTIEASEAKTDRIQIGSSFTVMDYNQTGTPQTTQVWLGVEGRYEHELSKDWQVGLQGRMGVLPLSITGSRYSLRNASVSTELSYSGWTQSEEGVFPRLGYQYQTILNLNNYGYRNIHGPNLGVKFKFKKSDRNQVLLEQAVGLLLTDSAITLGNSELLFRVSYVMGGMTSWMSESMISFGVSRLSLAFKDGEVGSYSYSLQFSGTF